MDETRSDLTYAMDRVRNMVSAASGSAETLHRVAWRDPDLGTRLASSEAQLHAIADLARDIEREIALVHASHRAEA